MKKTKLHRAALAAALALLLLAVLAACGPDKGPDADSDRGGTDTVSAPTAEDTASPALILSEGGRVSVRIIMPDLPTDAEKEATLEISEYIRKVCGSIPEVTTDLLIKKVPEGSSVILVGSTALAPSREAAEKLDYGCWSVTVGGNCIVAAGMGDNAIKEAASALKNAFSGDRKTGELSLASDTALGGTSAPLAAALPRFGGGEYVNLYDAGDGYQLLLYRRASAAEYDSYLDLLAAAGYRKTAGNTIDGNRFDFYLCDSAEAALSFFPSSGEVRISVGAPSAVNGSDGVTVCTPELTMVGLAFDTKNNGTLYGNGLSIVIRLADGRFIIVDGGGKNDTHAKNLYDVLRAQAPDPENIVVAAWMLTHAHIDHVGTLYQFSRSYTQKLTVQNFIYNFPGYAYYSSLSADSEDGGTGMSDDIRASVGRFVGASVIKAHLGQRFEFSGAEIEILYTVEANYPHAVSANGNSTSMVFSVTLGGKKIMITGDCAVDASNIICRYYSSALKSDYVTVVHHGMGGATTQLYSLIDPDIVLWPSSREVHEQTRSRDYNVHLLNNLHVKEVHVAGSDIYTVQLTG